MKYQKLLHLTLLLPFIVSAQKISTRLADPAGPREHAADMIRMKLDVSFVPSEKLVKGRVTHVFNMMQDKADTLFFDGPKIRILSATLNGKPVAYDTNATGIIVRPSGPLTRRVDKAGSVISDSITFEYEANPVKGIYFIGWTSQTGDPKNFHSSRKQIWTQGQGIDNRHWIPMYDDMNDKLVTETRITFDKEYQVLSNGTRVGEKLNSDGTKTWHYRMTHPHASYLLMIAIGKYGVKNSKSASGVPVASWYYPEFPGRIEPTYRYTEKIMDFLEAETGLKYPWESYAQVPVQDFIYGAMENTTATIFGDFYHVDSILFNDRSYVGVNAHEMAHQWFGDYVTAWSNKDTWLQESFATHYAKHFKRSVYGEDHFQWDRRGEIMSSLGASANDRNPLSHSKAGGRIYPKGSVVLDMMRYVLGNDQYIRGLTWYLKRNPYGNVDAHDFYVAFHESLGINLDWFFEQWIYKGGEPEYEVSYRDIMLGADNSSRQTEIIVRQVHVQDDETGLFKMPIVFRVHYTDGSIDEKKEWISQEQQTVSVPNPSARKISFVLFDAGNNVLKKVKFSKSLSELHSQALKAKDMIDRYDAVHAMRDTAIAVKREMLIEIFSHEKFHAVKAEILSQLGADDNEKTIALFKKALEERDLDVRQAAVRHMQVLHSSLIPLVENTLRDSSYETIQGALEKLCAQNPSKKAEYLESVRNIYGPANSIRIKWIELLPSPDDKKYLPELIAMSGDGYEFRTRINALQALQRLNHLDTTVVRNLFGAITSYNNRLAGPASEVANSFYKQSQWKKMIREAYKSGTWTEREKEKLEKYGK